MCQDRQERPESSSLPLRAFIPGPVGGNPSFYPDNPHYTEAIPTFATVLVMRGRGLGSAHKKGTLKGCLVYKVRSFGQNPPAYPLRLTRYTSSPCGDYLRVLVLPC